MSKKNNGKNWYQRNGYEGTTVMIGWDLLSQKLAYNLNLKRKDNELTPDLVAHIGLNNQFELIFLPASKEGLIFFTQDMDLSKASNMCKLTDYLKKGEDGEKYFDLDTLVQNIKKHIFMIDLALLETEGSIRAEIGEDGKAKITGGLWCEC